MSNLSLTIGANTVSVPITLSNAQANAVLRRYAINSGIAVDGRTAAQIGTDVLRSLLRHVKQVSSNHQRGELMATQLATLEAQIATDNDLFDDAP